MKPYRIVLLRHAESEGNANKKIFTEKPSYAYKLTERGRRQAAELGSRLADVVGDGRVFCYVSPFYRTRETFEVAMAGWDKSKYSWREEPRLREQERAGKMRPEDSDDCDAERNDYGSFYYRFDGGESCADVYDRVSSFLDTLFRDFDKPDYPPNVFVFSHGMALRVLLMRWFHWTVEEFELVSNPLNCGGYVMHLHPDGKYKLAEQPAKYEKPVRKY